MTAKQSNIGKLLISFEQKTTIYIFCLYLFIGKSRTTTGCMEGSILGKQQEKLPKI